MKSIKSLIFGAVLGSMALSLSSCGAGGGTSTWGTYQSPGVTVNSFINGLNNADGTSFPNDSFLEVDQFNALRSSVAGQDQWFVIWDANYGEHKAVSLQYIRSIVYYDYYANSTGLADEFRNIETDDILNGFLDGDLFGDDYEVVDEIYIGGFGTGIYEGRESFFLYEDEAEVTDVALMGAEKQKKAFIKQAAAVSYTYNVSIRTSLSLVSLGYKVEKAVRKGRGELTPDDQAAVLGDIEKLTGKTFQEVIEASNDIEKKNSMVKDIAKKLGTTSQNLEDRLLPELFGIE